eukprot:scaffold589159_cov18-Prasinocladus_malaysianus.AAC.1
MDGVDQIKLPFDTCLLEKITKASNVRVDLPPYVDARGSVGKADGCSRRLKEDRDSINTGVLHTDTLSQQAV